MPWFIASRAGTCHGPTILEPEPKGQLGLTHRDPSTQRGSSLAAGCWPGSPRAKAQPTEAKACGPDPRAVPEGMRLPSTPPFPEQPDMGWHDLHSAGFSGHDSGKLWAGCALWDGPGVWQCHRAASPLGGEGPTLALPCSFFLMTSYYGLVLDLQNLGSDIFLLQVLFGAVDIVARVTTVFLFRFFGRRMTLASFQTLAGFCILANMLVPQGEARAAWMVGWAADGLGHWLPAHPCHTHHLGCLPLPGPQDWGSPCVQPPSSSITVTPLPRVIFPNQHPISQRAARLFS